MRVLACLHTRMFISADIHVFVSPHMHGFISIHTRINIYVVWTILAQNETYMHKPMDTCTLTQAHGHMHNALVIWLAVTRTRRLLRGKLLRQLQLLNARILSSVTRLWHDYTTGALEEELERQLRLLECPLEEQGDSCLSLYARIVHMHKLDAARAMKVWRQEVQDRVSLRRDMLHVWVKNTQGCLRDVVLQWRMLVTVRNALVTSISNRFEALRLEDAFERWWGKVYLRAQAVWKVMICLCVCERERVSE
jgi:hypothetical protein